MQLVSRISQLENRGGFLFVPPFLPRVFRTRFALSRGTIPKRNRGKRIAQRSMWQEKDRCRGLFLIEIQFPSFGNVSLWNEVGRKKDSRRKVSYRKRKKLRIEVWRNFAKVTVYSRVDEVDGKRKNLLRGKKKELDEMWCL